jgi:hypothetical protein
MGKHETAWWIAGGFAVAAILAASVLATTGVDAHGTSIALRVTARLSFLIFCPAYIGGAMAELFGPRFLPVKRRGRMLGLAYAAAQVVHLSLVGWLCWIGAAPGIGVFVIFGAAAICTYLLALGSIGALQRALGPTGWRVLRFVGMNYIALAFLKDFLRMPRPPGLRDLAFYGPFLALSIVAPLLYGAGFVLSAGRSWLEPDAIRPVRSDR